MGPYEIEEEILLNDYRNGLLTDKELQSELRALYKEAHERTGE